MKNTKGMITALSRCEGLVIFEHSDQECEVIDVKVNYE